MSMVCLVVLRNKTILLLGFAIWSWAMSRIMWGIASAEEGTTVAYWGMWRWTFDSFLGTQSMTLWPFRKECRAIAAISLETVAEKNNVWRSFGRWSMMNLRSSEKPISRSVSASSSTSISVLANASFTRGSEIKSLNRPGVATTTSLDRLENSFNCLSRLSPPTNE